MELFFIEDLYAWVLVSDGLAGIIIPGINGALDCPTDFVVAITIIDEHLCGIFNFFSC